MQYRESTPTPRLREYIKLFWSLEYDPAAGELETVLPDGCPEIVFNLSDRFRRNHNGGEEVQPATIFAGQMSGRISIRPTGKVRLFGVRFRPAGAYPLVPFPMRDLTDEIPDIAACMGRIGTELEEKINVSESFEERSAIIEDLLLLKLTSARKLNSVASRVAQLIVERGGSTAVTALAREIGFSERSLERVFRNQVGISPKLLSRIIRFQSLISLIQKAKTPGSLDASLDLGYFDQSHAIRDFREFSGVTPMGYFRMTHGLSDVFTDSRA